MAFSKTVHRYHYCYIMLICTLILSKQTEHNHCCLLSSHGMTMFGPSTVSPASQALPYFLYFVNETYFLYFSNKWGDNILLVLIS